MLILYAALFVPTLSSVLDTDQRSTSNFVKSKRGVVETDHDAPQDYQFQRSKSNTNPRSLQSNDPKSYYQDVKGVSSVIGPATYDGIFKQPYVHQPGGQVSEQSPYFGNLFTMSAGYKVANEPAKQTRNQSPVIGVQVPVYKTNFPLPKTSGSQIYVPNFQNNAHGKVPILQGQNGQQFPGHFANVQSQPMILHPADQFNYPVRTPKVTNVQLSAPFLSPLSRFHGQVVPISTAGNSQQFPQYKGAAIEVYPTVSGFSTGGYQPLQTQPQLHFEHGNVQQVQNTGGHGNLPPAQDIRSQVEIINKKKPSPPTRTDGEDDEEDDEGYTPPEKERGQDDDDYESKPEKHFKAPRTEGDFKPSRSFPFKQYDEKFGKYSNQDRDEEADEKPFSKYRDYPSSSDDDDDDEEDTPSAKYHSEDTSSRPYYSKDNDEEDEENGHGYEKQKTEESSDDTYRPKYFDKDFDEEYEASYRRDFPKQKYPHVRESPETRYGSRSSRRNKGNYEDAAGQGSRTSFKYHETPLGFKDNEGESSDILTEVTYGGGFGYKLPENIRSFNRVRSIVD